MSREKIREMIEEIADVRNENKHMYVWVNYVMIEKPTEFRFEVSYNNETDEYTLFLVNKKEYRIIIAVMEHVITDISYEVTK